MTNKTNSLIRVRALMLALVVLSAGIVSAGCHGSDEPAVTSPTGDKPVTKDKKDTVGTPPLKEESKK